MFWDLLKQSVITRMLIALMFTATICFMYGTQIEVPEGLQLAVGVIIGFFFAGVEAAVIRSRLSKGS